MKSFLENFKELSVDELLSINGGYSVYSHGGHSGSGGGTGNGRSSGYGLYSSSSCGERFSCANKKQNDDVPDKINKHGLYGYNIKETKAYNEKYVGLGWTSTEIADEGSTKTHSERRDEFLDRISALSETSNNGESAIASENFVKSLKSHQYDKYQTQETKDYDVYMCDDFVQKVLTDAGVDYNNYFAGPAALTNCDTHIKEKALAGGSGYTKHVPTEKGVYVVLMNNSAKGFRAHTAFYVVDEYGSYAIDNSSGNYTFKDGNDDRRKGGVEETICNSSGLCCKFGYNDFYYKQVEF